MLNEGDIRGVLAELHIDAEQREQITEAIIAIAQMLKARDIDLIPGLVALAYSEGACLGLVSTAQRPVVRAALQRIAKQSTVASSTGDQAIRDEDLEQLNKAMEQGAISIEVLAQRIIAWFDIVDVTPQVAIPAMATVIGGWCALAPDPGKCAQSLARVADLMRIASGAMASKLN